MSQEKAAGDWWGPEGQGPGEPAPRAKVAAGERPGHGILKASATKHVSKRALSPLALAAPTSVNVAAMGAVLSRRGGGSAMCVLDFQRGQEIPQPASEEIFFFHISGNQKYILLLPFVSMEFLSAFKMRNSASSYSFAILRGT